MLDIKELRKDPSAFEAKLKTKIPEVDIGPVITDHTRLPAAAVAFSVAFAPLFIMWMGFTVYPKILVAILIVFFPVMVNVLTAVRTVDPDLINLARAFKASRAQIFWKIEFPSSLPALMAGLRIGATLAVIGVTGSNSSEPSPRKAKLNHATICDRRRASVTSRIARSNSPAVITLKNFGRSYAHANHASTFGFGRVSSVSRRLTISR